MNTPKQIRPEWIPAAYGKGVTPATPVVDKPVVEKGFGKQVLVKGWKKKVGAKG
jgi:hypothetical protein